MNHSTECDPHGYSVLSKKASRKPPPAGRSIDGNECNRDFRQVTLASSNRMARSLECDIQSCRRYEGILSTFIARNLNESAYDAVIAIRAEKGALCARAEANS